MIYPLNDTFVNYLNCDNGSHGNILIQDIITKNFYASTETEKGVFSFDKIDIMIRSWNGWTKLLFIKKYPIDTMKKYYRLRHRINIVLSDDHIIPCYCKENINNPVNGFHGSIDYEYTAMELSRYIQRTSKFDMMRFYRSPSENGFIVPYIEDFDNIDDTVFCYDIITESKFFNLNDFYLF